MEVEAVQLVASLLGVHDIFEDDEGGAFGVVGDALADLAAAHVSQWSRAISVKWRANLPHGTEFAKQLEELFGRDVVIEVLYKKRAAAGLVMRRMGRTSGLEWKLTD